MNEAMRAEARERGPRWLAYQVAYGKLAGLINAAGAVGRRRSTLDAIWARVCALEAREPLVGCYEPDPPAENENGSPADVYEDAARAVGLEMDALKVWSTLHAFAPAFGKKYQITMAEIVAEIIRARDMCAAESKED